MPTTHSRFKKMLLMIQDIFSLRVCVKKKSSNGRNTDEKILRTFEELTVGISEVFQDGENSFDDFLRCDRIACKINVLSEQISQVRILYMMWRNGYDMNLEELTMKCRSLNVLIDCIRDDVFNAYLRLPPDQKLAMLKKNKQVSPIFAVLGALENQVSTMLKTMIPHGGIVRTLKPLLNPRLNKVIYKKTTKNIFNYHIPNSHCMSSSADNYRQTMESGTDPIGEKELEEASTSKIETADSMTTVNSLISEEDIQKFGQIPNSVLGFVKEKGIRNWENPTDTTQFVDTAKNLASNSSNNLSPFSFLLEDKTSFEKPLSTINFWKVAAELAADHPICE